MHPTIEHLAKRALPLSVLRWAERAVAFERPLGLTLDLPSGVHLSIETRSDWVLYTDIFVHGEYDAPIDAALAQAGGRPLRVLDLGANVGFFTLRLFDRIRSRGATEGGVQVTLVEGSPLNARILRERLRDADLPPEATTVVHGLVGHRSGSGHLTQNRNSGMSNILSGSALAESVGFVDLETLAGDERIDLLKCDIEGAEEMFLRAYGSLLRRCERAVFEFHPLLCDVDRCKRLLRDAGLVHETVLRAHPEFEVTSFHR